jgi:signal transduction histidine kinase
MGWNDGLIFLVYAVALLAVAGLSVLILSIRQKRTIRKIRAHEQSQANLLNILVHDILNPILAARFSLENLKRELHGASQRHVQQAIDSVEELNKLIQRVRDMRAFDSGRKQLRIAATSVNDLLKVVEKTFAARADSEEIRLIVTPLAVDCSVDVDPVIFVSNVLNNLVDNAFKFSRRGLKIQVSAEDVGTGVEFQVRDEGVGMDSRLTGTLNQGLGGDVRPDHAGQAGTGIGMLQVNSYLRLAGGALSIQSRPEQAFPEEHGTTVKINLPRHPLPAGAGG